MILQRIVVVTTEPEIQQLARQAGREIFVADDAREAFDIIESVCPDLVVLDNLSNPAETHDFLAAAEKLEMNIPIVVVDNIQNENESHMMCQSFIKLGARDYLACKSQYHNLKQIAVQIKNLSHNNDFAKHTCDFFAEDYAASVLLVGKSKATKKTLEMIKLVAMSKCNPVLIVGKTGTGKELAAKAVHNLRHQNDNFIAVNCAALTANLLESELFGHVKGSFTSAEKEKTGLFELAENGSIFLDEISEMPLDLQAKLLRVLQEKTFRKVGGLKNIKCNATIIASSNRNLKFEVKQNRFRADLYYRLTICPIYIKPLRSLERRDDIQLLAEFFLKNSDIVPEKENKIASMTKLALEALQNHDWPGNVRELKNVIERAILIETTEKIGLNSIIIDPEEQDESCQNKTTDNTRDFSLEKAERQLIARALQQTGWQKTKTAALLGITRATLYAKLKQYNIEKIGYIPGRVQQNNNPAINTFEPLAIS